MYLYCAAGHPLFDAPASKLSVSIYPTCFNSSRITLRKASSNDLS
jgi:hypothetical protein